LLSKGWKQVSLLSCHVSQMNLPHCNVTLQ
jgi:hypothetical protein